MPKQALNPAFLKQKPERKRLKSFINPPRPMHLLKLPFANDNNRLNKEFYAELLHIIGLEEVMQENKKLIVRKKEGHRDSGSIIENAIERINVKNKWNNLPASGQYASQFDVALDLALTWINRILFLKLIESQIVKYHNGNREYAFLSPEKLSGYNDLDTLFFSILARREDERQESIRAKFAHVPYLNSSLFEVTEIESKTICIDSLQENVQIELYPKSVLFTTPDFGLPSQPPRPLRIRPSKGGKFLPSPNWREGGGKVMRPLEYLLRFLDAYDFSSERSNEIQEANKTSIPASVLGLIFEKINGYKDGSFFTPSFITMYMCRETIGRAVVQKFNEVKELNCQSINDLCNKIEDIAEVNTIFNTIRVCDPAVGSGHFLVSVLNEMIYLKSELGILTDKNGKRLINYRVAVENDELMITDNEGNYFTYNPKNAESQRVQEALFSEKQTIIKNCLFGVDINPNSVKICQLRLWIELLKHTYYRAGTNELETLPTIDINIKCGNSLISRSDLHANKEYQRLIEAENYSNAFEWRFEFPEVLDDEGNFTGFDVVIGNPPYGTDIDKFVQLFQKLYPKTSHGFKDIYKYFFDKSLSLLNKNGLLSFITPNTFLRQPRYGDLRRLLLEKSIVQLIDLGENVFDAVVPTAISMISMRENEYVLFADLTKHHNLKLAIQNAYFQIIDKRVFKETPNNLFVVNARKKTPDQYVLDDILKIKDAGFKYQRSNVGMREKGNNDLADRIFYIGKRQNNNDIPLLVGKDISAFYHSDCPEKKLRFNYQKKLKLNEKTYYNKKIMGEKTKLIWRQTASYFIGTILKDPIFFGNTIQAGIIKEEFKEKVTYEYLCGLLNSMYLRYLYDQNVKEERRVFPQVKLEKMKMLPIIIAEDQQPIITLVNAILSAKQANPLTDTSELERKIDNLVYTLYSLTEEEVRMVEGGSLKNSLISQKD